MAEAQWVAVTIEAVDVDLHVGNAAASYGKFFRYPHKDEHLSASHVNAIRIPAGSKAQIAARGNPNAAAGTTGSFDLYDPDRTLVGQYSWDCPWGRKSNKSDWMPSSMRYSTEASPGNLDSGAIGNVTIRCERAHRA